MISVLIASMGRETLAATLASVARARVPPGETVEIILADDSPDGRAGRLAASLALPPGVKVVDVAAGNVAVARNACLNAARGRWLAFVDDDETVEPGWLEGHLSAALDFGADAVFGPVYPRYPQGTPAWFVAADPLFQDWGWGEDGRRVRRGRTGNTLVRHAALGGLRFDPAYGRSGGEDHDFFLRLAAAGARMIVTDRARVHETVPPERAKPAYVLARQIRTGQIYARMRLRGQGGRPAAAALGLDAAGKLAVAATAAVLLRPFGRPGSFRMLMRAATNLGKLRGLSAARLEEAWD